MPSKAATKLIDAAREVDTRTGAGLTVFLEQKALLMFIAEEEYAGRPFEKDEK